MKICIRVIWTRMQNMLEIFRSKIPTIPSFSNNFKSNSPRPALPSSTSPPSHSPDFSTPREVLPIISYLCSSEWPLMLLTNPSPPEHCPTLLFFIFYFYFRNQHLSTKYHTISKTWGSLAHAIHISISSWDSLIGRAVVRKSCYRTTEVYCRVLTDGNLPCQLGDKLQDGVCRRYGCELGDGEGRQRLSYG